MDAKDSDDGFWALKRASNILVGRYDDGFGGSPADITTVRPIREKVLKDYQKDLF